MVIRTKALVFMELREGVAQRYMTVLYISDQGSHSKPGASAVAAWLHFLVVGLHSRGQGALLGEVIWTSSRVSISLSV